MDTQELLSRVAENLSVHRSFGTAYEKNGLLIIPVAVVAGGGGGGEGTMPSPSSAAVSGQAVEATNGHTQATEGDLSTGTGGGFGGLVLPIGAYVVKGDQVRWVPAVDVTIIVLASLSLVRLLLRLRTRVRRRHLIHP